MKLSKGNVLNPEDLCKMSPEEASKWLEVASGWSALIVINLAFIIVLVVAVWFFYSEVIKK